MDVWRIESNMVRPHQVLEGRFDKPNVSELPQRWRLVPASCGGSSPRGDLTLWVPNRSSTLCDLGVFVDQSASRSRRRRRGWAGDAGGGSALSGAA